MTIDLHCSSIRESELLHKVCVEPLLKSLQWKKDNQGRMRITFQAATNLWIHRRSWKYFLFEKDYEKYRKSKLYQNDNAFIGLYKNLDKKQLAFLVYHSLTKEFTKLYKDNKLDAKRKNLRNKLEDQRKKNNKKARERALNQKKDTALEFKVNAQRDISRIIILAALNEKLNPLGLAFVSFTASHFGGSSKLTDFLDSKNKEVQYLFKAAERNLSKPDITGNTLFLALKELVGPESVAFLERNLLMHENQEARRFAIAFSNNVTIGLLDKDIIVRAAAEKRLKEVV